METTEILRRIDPHVRGLLRELESLWCEVVAGVEPPSASVDATLSAPAEPHAWVEQRELENQTDVWPKAGGGKDIARFERFRVFERDDGLRIGLGHNRREDGLPEIGVFLLSPGGKKRLVVYFQPTDEFPTNGVMFAPIRGKGGGRSYFRGQDALPPWYAGKEVATLADVASGHRFRENKVLLAQVEDWETMAGHAATQIRIRGLTV